MSRCFPYPPPGYSVKSASNEALIESIKLRREREKAKTERKNERRREKKEKRKQNLSEIDHVEERKLNDEKIHKMEKSNGDLKGGCIQKGRKDEAEQLERSGLTEEHEPPIYSQHPCYSSDSTQNSNKRKSHASPLNGSRNHGTILRIRLPLKKHKEPDTLVSKEQFGFTSGRTDLTAQRKYAVAHGPHQQEFCSTSKERETALQAITPGPYKEPSCSTFGRAGTFARDNIQTTTVSTSVGNEVQRAESLYRDLVENWVPLPLAPQSEQSDFDDLEWLFGRKHQSKHGEKRSTFSDDANCCGSSELWPRAQYFPEADIYALPYTVPF
ncbi:hypothetical protein F0562_036121 [Nyssa sinensis]|uniref:Uncharacterized protein n=1 Tax=Nyssa sinensis TaxID=561372 RepID=A0A5J5AGA5_9ASTE|nr:hypothetical protein F0562_036121 [Nyssa sinensis]